MRIFRLLVPLLALISAFFTYKRKTSSMLISTPTETEVNPDALIDVIAMKPDDEFAIERFMNWLDDELTDIQRSVVIERQDDLMPALLYIIANGRTDFRKTAAVLLGLLGGEAAREALLIALSDYSFWVRGAAVESLGKLADTVSISALAKLLSDPEAYVRERAVLALRTMGTDEALAVLATYQPQVFEQNTQNQHRRFGDFELDISDDAK